MAKVVAGKPGKRKGSGLSKNRREGQFIPQEPKERGFAAQEHLPGSEQVKGSMRILVLMHCPESNVGTGLEGGREHSEAVRHLQKEYECPGSRQSWKGGARRQSGQGHGQQMWTRGKSRVMSGFYLGEQGMRKGEQRNSFAFS